MTIADHESVVPLEWTEADSRDFIQYGHLFTPQDVKLRRIIRSLVAGTSNGKKVAELGCGAGQLVLEILTDDLQSSVCAIDRSAEMLREAKRNCASYVDRVEFICGDLEDTDIPPKDRAFSVVVSMLAIHHLDDMQKKSLFGRIHDALCDGGLFIYCDLFRPNSAEGWKIAAEEWPKEVEEQGQYYHSENAIELFDNLKWNYYADPAGDPSDMPSSIFDVQQWLAAVGFCGCDIHWFSSGHGLLSAVKSGKDKQCQRS